MTSSMLMGAHSIVPLALYPHAIVLVESSAVCRLQASVTCCCKCRFEPWGLVCRHLTPFFDVRFRGYGKDKISYLRLLNTLDFRCEALCHRSWCATVQAGLNVTIRDELCSISFHDRSRCVALSQQQCSSPHNVQETDDCPPPKNRSIECRYTVRADGFIVHRPHASTRAKTIFVEELLAGRRDKQSPAAQTAVGTVATLPDSQPQEAFVPGSDRTSREGGSSGGGSSDGSSKSSPDSVGPASTDVQALVRVHGAELAAQQDVRNVQATGGSEGDTALEDEPQPGAEGRLEPIGEAEWTAAIDAANAPAAGPSKATTSEVPGQPRQEHLLEAVSEAEWTAALDAANAPHAEPGVASTRRTLSSDSQAGWTEALDAANAPPSGPSHASSRRVLLSGPQTPRLHAVTNAFYGRFLIDAQRGSYQVLVTGSFQRCLRQLPWWQDHRPVVPYTTVAAM